MKITFKKTLKIENKDGFFKEYTPGTTLLVDSVINGVGGGLIAGMCVEIVENVYFGETYSFRRVLSLSPEDAKNVEVSLET